MLAPVGIRIRCSGREVYRLICGSSSPSRMLRRLWRIGGPDPDLAPVLSTETIIFIGYGLSDLIHRDSDRT